MNNAEHNFDDSRLLNAVQQIESECGGRLCFALEDLVSGKTIQYRANEKCKTASTIKFPMLVHVAMSVQEGALDWNENLLLTDAEKVAGSGVLTQLSHGLEISLRDVCVLMTIVSDNTATNMVIERIGVEAINDRSRSLGLSETRLFRKSYHEDTPESAPFGLGVTTAFEMCRLMAQVGCNSASGDGAFREVLRILESQIYRDCIPRYLPSDWSYAGKTGAVDPVRNDVGLITKPDGSRHALAVFCQDLPEVLWTADNKGVIAIARTAKLLL